jgi:hypothetical protein
MNIKVLILHLTCEFYLTNQKVEKSIFDFGQNGFRKISKFGLDPKISKISEGWEFGGKVQKLVNFRIQILTLEPSYKTNEILLNSKRSHHLLSNSDSYILF